MWTDLHLDEVECYQQLLLWVDFVVGGPLLIWLLSFGGADDFLKLD